MRIIYLARFTLQRWGGWNGSANPSSATSRRITAWAATISPAAMAIASHPPLRPERHAPNSIETMRRRLVAVLAATLSRCPCLRWFEELLRVLSLILWHAPLGRPASPNPVPQNFLHGRLLLPCHKFSVPVPSGAATPCSPLPATTSACSDGGASAHLASDGLGDTPDLAADLS